MFNKLSITLFIVAAVAISGLVPVLVAGIGGLVVGLVVFVVLAVGSVFGLDMMLRKPIAELSQRAKKLDDAIEHEADFPDMAAVPPYTSSEIFSLATELHQAEASFQKRITELQSIHAISQTITSSTLDYEKTVKSVLAAVQQVVDYDAAEVAVLHGNSLVVEAWWGKDGFKDTTGRKYRLGKGPTGTIAATKEPLFLATVQPTEDIQRTIGYASVETEFVAKTTKLIINSFLGIPLLLVDQLIGTLTLVHHEEGFFTEDDMRQLNKLADHASIAIDNALKVKEREEALQNQIRELRIEIDQAKLASQVEEVTDSDFFRNLQDNAAKLRRRHQKGGDSTSESETEPETETETEEKLSELSSDDHQDSDDS